jgi:hypothetical protein
MASISNSGFALDLSRFVARAKGNAAAIVANVVLKVGEGIVMRTPVGDPTTWKHPERAPAGYVGGRARGSWQYGYNAPAAAEPGTIDSSGAVALGRITAGVSANQAPGVHYVTSSVPYMRPLEYEAHSKQAPEGMVRVTVAEFRTYVDRALGSITP